MMIRTYLSKSQHVTKNKGSSSLFCFQQHKSNNALIIIRSKMWRRNEVTTNKKVNNNCNTANDYYSASLSALIPAFGIGTLAGICGSLAGMGGGFVMIPLMTSTHPLLSMSLSQHVAHGTSLFAVAATGLAGAASYHTNGSSNTSAVNIESAICITVCAMMTARLGASYSVTLSQYKLKKILGFFMMGVSPIIPLKAHYLKATNEQENEEKKKIIDEGGSTKIKKYFNDSDYINQRIKDAMISGGIGLGSGFMAGMLGVGGGAVVVPALTVLTSMDHYTALGTSLAAMVLPAVVGTITHYQKGNVNLRIAPVLALGSLIGAYGGGKLGVNLEENLLRYGFSGLVFTLGLKTVAKG